jgi:hypothetical protein
MRIVQTFILKLLGLAAFVGGGAFLAMWKDDKILSFVLEHGKTLYSTPYYAPVAGGVLMFIAFIGIIPLRKKKRPRNNISFPGIRGDVTIELDSVEANLARVIGKMPEVKKIKVKVSPSEDNRRAVVSADVLMYKGSSGVSAHEIANRIADFLNDAAVNILGVEEVTKVNLNVRDIIVDSKQLAAAKRTAVPKAEDPAPAAPEDVEAAPEAIETVSEAEPEVVEAVPAEETTVVAASEAEAAPATELALGACDAAPAESAAEPENVPVVDSSEPGFNAAFSVTAESTPFSGAVSGEPLSTESPIARSAAFDAFGEEPKETEKKDAEPGAKQPWEQ